MTPPPELRIANDVVCVVGPCPRCAQVAMLWTLAGKHIGCPGPK